MFNATEDSGGTNALAIANRYRAFARLTADWFWELDENLCFSFHDELPNVLSDLRNIDLIGKNRVETLNQMVPDSEALQAHNHALENHLPLDVVMPVSHPPEQRHVHIVAQPEFDKQGVFLGYIGSGSDVTERVRIESQLAHLATHDDLTGVHNRREFEVRLDRICTETQNADKEYSLCFLDLDRFKHVNDSAGHPAGDKLLRELADLMRKHIGREDFIARLGGDEFGLLLCSDTVAARATAERLIDAITRHECDWGGTTYRVGASIGITRIAAELGNKDDLMVRADSACYAAKNNGRNQSFIAVEECSAQRHKVDKVSLVKRALQKSHYRLLMQPISSSRDEESFDRYELLVRLECDNGHLLEPAEFMPLAKHFDLMQALDRWVVENALLAMQRFHENDQDVALSINLSSNTLTDQRSIDQIVKICRKHKHLCRRICFDITETSAIRNIDTVIEFMQTMAHDGVEFALDDFGNGLCSVAYLQQLPIDYLKIDGMLIRKIVDDRTSRQITIAFHQLSNRLGIKTVAESVEDIRTAHCAKAIGIDYLQGFGVGELQELKTAVAIVSD